jgi:hypothetical protein
MIRDFYQVEQTYENFETGKKWTRLHPNLYKTWRNADKAAQGRCWSTEPERGRVIDRSSARVITVSGHETPKVRVSGHCQMFVEGMNMTCPLCGVLVKSGETHECSKEEPKKKGAR